MKIYKDKILFLETELLNIRNDRDQYMNQLEEMQNLNNSLITQLENSSKKSFVIEKIYHIIYHISIF